MGPWLSYEQAGRLLGLSAEAVRHRARRLQWPTQRGNRPNDPTLVQVPEGVRPIVRTPARSADNTPDQAEALERAESRIRELRAALERAEGERAEAQREAAEKREALARAEGEAAGLKEALRIAEAASREAQARADKEAEARRQASQTAAQKALQVDAARRDADDAKRRAEAAEADLAALRALPWWRRLRGR